MSVAPALEAYMGGRQFWLLVRTLDEAQEGIELLKQRRAGRATYLPLERCRPRDRDAHFVTRLFSSIKIIATVKVMNKIGFFVVFK